MTDQGQAAEPNCDQSALSRARVVFINYSGDYSEAWHRLNSGGGETYFAQRYSVELTGSLAAKAASVAYICIRGTQAYDELLPNGVRAIGLGRGDRYVLPLIRLLERLRPTHVVLGTVQWEVIAWALVRRIHILPMFADSFHLQSPRAEPRALLRFARHSLRHKWLATLLSTRKVPWVCNHNIPSSRELEKIGVPATKILAWDWPPQLTPQSNRVKPAPVGRTAKIVFVGAMTETKGCFDALRAVSQLIQRGYDLRLDMFGSGDADDSVRSAIAAGGLEGRIKHQGRRAHDEIIAALLDADISLVPSWHEYPEGLPMTIYEALATRTPLVCSDHPMFREFLSSRVEMFPQKNVPEFAAAIARLIDDPEHFAQRSESTAATWSTLQRDLRPAELLHSWISDPTESNPYLASKSLARLCSAPSKGSEQSLRPTQACNSAD